LVNFVSGDAWPGGQHLVGKLGLSIRTIRRSVAELEITTAVPDNYLHVTRSGRSNRYRPNFALIENKLLPLDAPESKSGTGANNDSERCQFGTPTSAKNVPLSLSSTTYTSLQRATSDDAQGPAVAEDWKQSRDAFRRARAVLKVSVADDVAEGTRRLREQRGDQGDEKIELEAARLIGSDGYEVLERLHEVDEGQPRLRLLSLVRSGTLTQRDIESARLVAWNAPPAKRRITRR